MGFSTSLNNAMAWLAQITPDMFHLDVHDFKIRLKKCILKFEIYACTVFISGSLDNTIQEVSSTYPSWNISIMSIHIDKDSVLHFN